MGFPQDLGRVLILAGLVISLLGLLLTLAGKTPFPGQLPGDLVIERRNFTLYVPVATSLLLSVVLSVLLWVWRR